MELKKSPKADLQNKRGLFMEIGLLVAIGVMILAFNWGQHSKVIKAIDTQIAAVESEMVEITREPPKEIKQPQANVQIQSEVLNLVRDDIKIEVDPKFVELDEDRPLIVPDGSNGDGSGDGDPGDEVFLFVGDGAKFQDGDPNTTFYAWAARQIANNYPAAARNAGIQGTVLVSFIVEKDGTLSNITVMQSPDASLSNSIIEMLKRSPKWKPAQQGRFTIRQGLQMAFNFRLK